MQKTIFLVEYKYFHLHYMIDQDYLKIIGSQEHNITF